jgi:hypothetical protein
MTPAAATAAVIFRMVPSLDAMVIEPTPAPAAAATPRARRSTAALTAGKRAGRIVSAGRAAGDRVAIFPAMCKNAGCAGLAQG